MVDDKARSKAAGEDGVAAASDCSSKEELNEEAKEGEVRSNVSEISLQNKVKELKEQVATLREAVMRKLAETENLRKRLEKEKLDAMRYANSRFAKDLLGVIDNFDRVVQHVNTLNDEIKNNKTVKPIKDGVELCGKELLSILRKHGIECVSVSEGSRFDPNYHQAMCEVESDKHSPGTVVNVIQPGYTYNDRLLRPAMVSVAKKVQIEN